MTSWVLAAAFLAAFLQCAGVFAKDFPLKVVTGDVTRRFLLEANVVFARRWQEQTDNRPVIQLDGGPAERQTQALIDGLDADVALLALEPQIDRLVDGARLLPREWRKNLPGRPTPFTSTIVFVVRRGNPRAIKDWDDLVRPNVPVVALNPRTSGSGRWTYLAAWAWAERRFVGEPDRVRAFVTRFYAGLSGLQTTTTDATAAFSEKNVGDVLVTLESEALTILADRALAGFEIVVPSTSLVAEPPVTTLDTNTRRRGTQRPASAYVEFLFSEEGQTIAARHFFRPRNPEVWARESGRFLKSEAITVDAAFGGWPQVVETHFRTDGMLDQVLPRRRP